jgi:RNA polymerase sigma-70 factor (ECF subfamily)
MPTTDLITLTDELRVRLAAYIQARVHSREMAEDLTQETFLRASRAIEGEDITNIEGWLFRVARNGIADYFRRSKEHVEWRDEEHGEAAHDDAILKEERELREELSAYVRGVVENLAEPYRSALVQTEFEGLTQKQLAEREGITLSAAKSRVQRGRAELKRVIEQCCRISTDRYGQVTDCEPHRRDSCAC